MKPKSMEAEAPRNRSCCCNCIEPILCSCYQGMAWLLAKVFMMVATCFLVYFCFLTILQRREPGEALGMAVKDFVHIFYPTAKL